MAPDENPLLTGGNGGHRMVTTRSGPGNGRSSSGST